MQTIKLDLINFNNETENHDLIPYLFKLTGQLMIKSQFKMINHELHVSVEGSAEKVESFVSGVRNRTKSTDNDSIGLKKLDNKGPCPECLKEVFNPKSRRHGYHLSSCNNCGPKISFTYQLPFVREKTLLNGINPCPECQSEMNSSTRFHNHPLTVCPNCGPKLKLYDGDYNEIPSKDVIGKAAYLINKGDVVAAKTNYGYKLFASPFFDMPFQKIQKITINPNAVEFVFYSLSKIKKLFEVDKKDEELLMEHKTVGLRLKYRHILSRFLRSDNCCLPCKIAPSLMHALIIAELDEPFLVEGCAAEYDETPLFDDELAVKSLKNHVEYFLSDGLMPTVISQQEAHKKTSSGTFIYGPSINYFDVSAEIPIASMGYEETPSIVVSDKGKTVYLPLPGVLNNFQTLKRYKDSYFWLKKILKTQPQAVVVTPRPDSIIERFASKEPSCLLKVQHHHAHAVSVMVENKLDEDVLAVVFDSGGYLPEGDHVGGEFLIANRSTYKRVAFFEEFLLPGPKICSDDPWRIAFALLHKAYGEDFFPYPQLFNGVSQLEISLVKAMLDQKINCKTTNSLTYFMNGLISLAGMNHKNRYKNETFEQLSYKNNFGESFYPIHQNRLPEIKITPLIKQIYKETFQRGTDEILGMIRYTITHVTAEALIGLQKRFNINKVVLTGDFFEEGVVLEKLLYLLKNHGLNCYTNKKLPLNDYNLAVGQIAIAAQGGFRPSAA